MATLKTFHTGESVSIGLLINEAYNISNATEFKVCIGSNAYTPVIIDRMLRVELTSMQTSRMFGTLKLELLVDDVTFGVKTFDVGELEFNPTRAQKNDESINTGYDVVIPVTITSETITVGTVMYNYVLGARGAAFTYEDFTPEQLDALKVKGDPFTYADFTEEQLLALKGADGYTPQKGIDYEDGADGYTPQKGIDYEDGADGYTPVKDVDYFDGNDGLDGRGEVSRELISTAGLVKTYRITYTDSTTFEYSLTDGSDANVTNQNVIAALGFTPDQKAKNTYTAFISQTGTNAPTEDIKLKDNLNTPVWSYSSVGTYLLTKSGAFTVNKTIPNKAEVYVDNAGNKMTLERTSADVMTLKTYAAADTTVLANGVITGQYINIEVYL